MAKIKEEKRKYDCEYHRENREIRLEKMRLYYFKNIEKRKKYLEKTKESRRAYCVKNREKIAKQNSVFYHENKNREEVKVKSIEAKRRYGELHPDRVRCRKALQCAVFREKIKRGHCDVCGSTDNVDGHHEDYSKPLDVRWLCHKHHMEFHREN